MAAWRRLLILAAATAVAAGGATANHSAQTGAALRSVVATTQESSSLETALESWVDAKRMRTVPVKLYFPVTTARTALSEKFPVILFSHGLGGSREGGKYWAQEWARHGFIVVAMQHPGSDEAIWKGAPSSAVADKLKAAMTLDNLSQRVADVHFVIDEVFRRSAAGYAVFEHANSKRIGLSGHSFGAQTALAVAGQQWPQGGKAGFDSRITAAIAFSPNARNKTNLSRQFGSISLPFFSITGSDDGSILGDGTQAADRRAPFDHMPAGDKFLAVFDGSDHMVFGGHELSGRRAETVRDRVIKERVNAATVAFWKGSLKADGDARRWLTDGGFKATLDAKDLFETK